MAEIEEEEKTAKDWARILLPRVMRAMLWGFLMGGEMLILLNLFGEMGQLLGIPFVEPTDFQHFLLIFIGFEVAIQLLRGTIFPYALGIARALTSMTILVYITNGGIITMQVPSTPQIPLPPEMNITFTIEFKAILKATLLLSSLGIVKNLLQAVRFLSEKEEDPVILPELP